MSPLKIEFAAMKALEAGAVETTAADHEALAIALVIQGYGPTRAVQIATEASMRTDGAVQMLARHRIAASKGEL